MKAIILAGGYGKRLRPLTTEKPKPLIEIAKKPILAIQFEWLKNHGINEVILCVGFLKEKIIEYVGNGRRFGMRVGYAVEEEPLGTGGALLNSELLLKGEDRFVVLNGDVITDLDLSRLISHFDKPIGAIALVPLRSTYGVVMINDKGEITEFKEKPILKDFWINAGVYCLNHAIFKYLPEKGDIEATAFPKLAEEKKLGAVKYATCFWRAIDVQKDIEEAEKDLSMRKSKT
ncbi:MAG: nucleotidyltransferase family protein [Nitrososphaerales archaeon]